jgi:hypothetical protein
MSATVRMKCPLAPCTVDLVHEVTEADHSDGDKTHLRMVTAPESTEHVHSHVPRQEQA